jgi:hypothetical protein
LYINEVVIIVGIGKGRDVVQESISFVEHASGGRTCVAKVSSPSLLATAASVGLIASTEFASAWQAVGTVVSLQASVAGSTSFSNGAFGRAGSSRYEDRGVRATEVLVSIHESRGLAVFAVNVHCDASVHRRILGAGTSICEGESESSPAVIWKILDSLGAVKSEGHVIVDREEWFHTCGTSVTRDYGFSTEVYEVRDLRNDVVERIVDLIVSRIRQVVCSSIGCCVLTGLGESE